MRREIQLYVIRHGVAAERGDAWPDDSERPLTSNGAARLRRAGRSLASLGVVFDLILTSPLVRALQTAEILADAQENRPPIAVLDALSPGGAHAGVLAELEKHARKARKIAIVGHAPGIGELAARLISARRPLALKKGAIARIDVAALPTTEPGILRWLLPPKLLRAIKT